MICGSTVFPVGKVWIQNLEPVTITASLEHRSGRKKIFSSKTLLYLCLSVDGFKPSLPTSTNLGGSDRSHKAFRLCLSLFSDQPDGFSATKMWTEAWGRNFVETVQFGRENLLFI